jgi:hypothetical protein
MIEGLDKYLTDEPNTREQEKDVSFIRNIYNKIKDFLKRDMRLMYINNYLRDKICVSFWFEKTQIGFGIRFYKCSYSSKWGYGIDMDILFFSMWLYFYKRK